MEEYRRLCRWEDNIKLDLKEMDMLVMNWVELDGDNWKVLFNMTLNFRVP